MISALFRILAATLALMASLPARAEWYEASSDHFVIYADDKEADIRKFAENLERYHSAMAFVLKAKIEKPSPSNRVTIYVVGGERDMRALTGAAEPSAGSTFRARAAAAPSCRISATPRAIRISPPSCCCTNMRTTS